MFGYERWSAMNGITRIYFPTDRARDRFMHENFYEKYNRIYTQVYIHIHILRKNINVYTHKCTYVPNECTASQRDSNDNDRKINLNRVLNLLRNQVVLNA